MLRRRDLLRHGQRRLLPQGSELQRHGKRGGLPEGRCGALPQGCVSRLRDRREEVPGREDIDHRRRVHQHLHHRQERREGLVHQGRQALPYHGHLLRHGGREPDQPARRDSRRQDRLLHLLRGGGNSGLLPLRRNLLPCQRHLLGHEERQGCDAGRGDGAGQEALPHLPASDTERQQLQPDHGSVLRLRHAHGQVLSHQEQLRRHEGRGAGDAQIHGRSGSSGLPHLLQRRGDVGVCLQGRNLLPFLRHMLRHEGGGGGHAGSGAGLGLSEVPQVLGIQDQRHEYAGWSDDGQQRIHRHSRHHHGLCPAGRRVLSHQEQLLGHEERQPHLPQDGHRGRQEGLPNLRVGGGTAGVLHTGRKILS